MNRLREFRERKGWPQAELCRRTGISYSSISRFESLVAIPSLRLKKKLAKVLRVSIKKLFPVDELSEKQRNPF